MPSNPPGQPPSAPNITRTDSATRQPDRCALHLSNPKTRNAAALNAANQMAANESGIFKRGLILAFCFQMACKFALANWLPRRESHPDFRFQRPAHFDYATRQLNMVAREGYAPSTSGCRPDVMLFHHRAVETRPVKMVASPGFAPGPSGSKPGMLRLHHEAVEIRYLKIGGPPG